MASSRLLPAGREQRSETPYLKLCVGVTAHRDLLPGEVPGIEQRLHVFFGDLARKFPDLPLQLLTPLAEGGDRLAARVALQRGIEIVAALPMRQADYEKDFGTQESIDEFRGLLDQAAAAITLPAVTAHEGNGREPSQRQLQYAQLGVFVSNHCHVLLALWDGRTNSDPGGTGQVVQYHLTAVMQGYSTAASAASLLADNENDLVFHVVCSRDRPGGEPLAGLEPLACAWFSSREQGRRFKELPAEYEILLGRFQRFVRDWKEKQEIVRDKSVSLLPDRPPATLPSGSEFTDRLFRAADALAVHYRQRVHGSLRAIYVLAGLMGLVFLAWSETGGPRYMVLVFLGLFFAGVVLHIIGSRREWHRKYLDYRALAEGLRVQLYWNLAGVVDSSKAGFAYDNFLQKQDVDLGWVRHVMRQASMYRVRGEEPDPAWVGWVAEEWVGRPGGGTGQLAWYSIKEKVNAGRYRRTELLGNLCLWAGIAVAALLFLAGSDADPQQWQLLMVLMGALPLVAGVWDAYSQKMAEKELIRQYAFMGRVFGKAGRLLEGATDIGLQRRVLQALGEAALEEGAEWLLIHRERPPEHGRL